jgi:hypothetical protein
LTRIKGDDPRYFTIKTLENETIKCYYPVDWEKDIVAFFKSTVTVKGVMSKKARAKEMEAVKDIQAFTSFSLDSLDEYIFKQPITFRVSYDEQDDLWCLANEELSLAGFGPSFDEARSSLKDSLDSLIVEFLAFDDSTLTEKAKKIKKNLQNYLDLNEYQEQKGELTIGDQHAHKTA